MTTRLVKTKIKKFPTEVFFAKVLSFNVAAGTADVVCIDNNISIPDCQVSCSLPIGYNFGTKYNPAYEGDNEIEFKTSSADLYCVACYAGDYQNTVILGFLPPRQCELTIPEHGLFIFRHESDVIFMIRRDGTMEMYHPSGSYIKIGEDDTDLANSDIEEDGLYPSTASGFRVIPTEIYSQFRSPGMFIRFWAGQKISLDKNSNIILNTSDSTVTMSTSTITLDAPTVNINAGTFNVTKRT